MKRLFLFNNHNGPGVLWWKTPKMYNFYF